jgi:peptidoglycan/LPS O-acetylase OafA/YrhL
MVVVNHLPAFVDSPHWVVSAGLGNPWVAIFIVLSGFSLYLPAAQQRPIQMPRGFGDFMKRRALRILPAWYAALALCVCTGAFLGLQGSDLHSWFLPMDGWDVFTHVTLTHSMTGYSGSIDGPGYTLGTEWQLYLLLLPFLVVVRRWGWLLLLVVVASTALPIPGIPGQLVHKALSTTFTVPFLLGMLSARLLYWGPYERVRVRGRNATTVVLWAFIAAGSVGYLELNDYSHDLACWAVALATGAACILMARRPRSLIGRAFSSRPITFVGSFAYSLYLTHFPLFALGAWAASALGIVGAQAFYLVFVPLLLPVFAFAYGFYLLFERPFLRSRQLPSAKQFAAADSLSLVRAQNTG